MTEQHEDYEGEDEDSESGILAPVELDKEFNFDRLRSASPGVNRVKPPPFDYLVEYPVNIKFESHLAGRAFYYKSNMPESAITDTAFPGAGYLLPHKWPYYYCGCIYYDNAFPPAPVNQCSIKPIESGERIIILTIEQNKWLGLSHTDRWRESCWLRLRPLLEAAFILHKQDRERQAVEEHHSLHSVYTEDGFIPKPQIRPGRKVNELNLTDTDYANRVSLVRRRATYKSRYLKDITMGKHGNRIAKALNEMYDLVETLGGVPVDWVKYSEDR